tara:strand:+ start:725 stop:913 length:189 start_codon:yes stop_codon:yes gene_type:complete
MKGKGKIKNPCKGKTGKVLQTCIKQYEYKKKLKKKDSAFNKRFKQIKSEYDKANTKRFEKIS